MSCFFNNVASDKLPVLLVCLLLSKNNQEMCVCHLRVATLSSSEQVFDVLDCVMIK